MQAAHYTANVEMLVGDSFERIVGLGNAGIEENIDIDSCCRDDLVIEKAEGSKVIKRIPGRREYAVEQCFQPGESQA